MEIERDRIVRVLKVDSFDGDIVALDCDTFGAHGIASQPTRSVPSRETVVIAEHVYIVPIYHQSLGELEGTWVDLGIVGLHQCQQRGVFFSVGQRDRGKQIIYMRDWVLDFRM